MCSSMEYVICNTVKYLNPHVNIMGSSLSTYILLFDHTNLTLHSNHLFQMCIFTLFNCSKNIKQKKIYHYLLCAGCFALHIWSNGHNKDKDQVETWPSQQWAIVDCVKSFWIGVRVVIWFEARILSQQLWYWLPPW